MTECPYADGECSSPSTCPNGCTLVKSCASCGYAPCSRFESNDEYDVCDGWIPPYYHDKGGTPEQYWSDEVEA